VRNSRLPVHDKARDNVPTRTALAVIYKRKPGTHSGRLAARPKHDRLSGPHSDHTVLNYRPFPLRLSCIVGRRKIPDFPHLQRQRLRAHLGLRRL
jgi:hypothetical protein